MSTMIDRANGAGAALLAGLTLAFAAASPTAASAASAADPTDPDRALDRPHAHDQERIIVDVEARRLWLVAGSDTLMSAPVAVGKGGTFRVGDRVHTFSTPKGRREVLEKREDPIWRPPAWHYHEKAQRHGLEVVALRDGQRVELSDGTFIEVRDNQVGRVNRWGNWWPFTPGSEMVFDGKIFMPPLSSPQREIPYALGPAKLDLGNGYMIHGTHRYNRTSIGDAASHGCIRMENDTLVVLYEHVEVGTPVVIT